MQQIEHAKLTRPVEWYVTTYKDNDGTCSRYCGLAISSNRQLRWYVGSCVNINTKFQVLENFEFKAFASSNRWKASSRPGKWTPPFLPSIIFCYCWWGPVGAIPHAKALKPQRPNGRAADVNITRDVSVPWHVIVVISMTVKRSRLFQLVVTGSARLGGRRLGGSTARRLA
ncbi:hypothetical protein AXF42_Ash005416 [Apostasia shenzhenica]|uniref:Uncharacterized protein n=1 Tax=Apostasia shenzhenica TaxID=1088818 RepID=A0A2I0B6Y0_9ASPA|nr:hypothetical protein AXF42_Ash005416 [Apostasia shenzhenica]